MNREECRRIWLAEEERAQIHGWDFSWIEDRYCEEGDLPWEYRDVIGKYLRPEMKLLDIDTGGGEMLRSLGHPYKNTAATEAYAPNVALCMQTLGPLGVDIREARGEGPLPWPEGSFDIITNRHGSYSAKEYFRVLKPGGIFVTQQVGAMNDRELVDLLCPGVSASFDGRYLADARAEFEEAGFEIVCGDECMRPIRFFDVGALVWFAKVIEWEFIGFSVEKNFEQLCRAQEILEETGSVDGRCHRFLLMARKK